MSEEQLKAFLEKVLGDTSLQEKLKAAADFDGVVAIAKETGFKISAEDLENVQSEPTAAELEGAAGGIKTLTFACCALITAEWLCKMGGGDWCRKSGTYSGLEKNC